MFSNRRLRFVWDTLKYSPPSPRYCCALCFPAGVWLVLPKPVEVFDRAIVVVSDKCGGHQHDCVITVLFLRNMEFLWDAISVKSGMSSRLVIQKSIAMVEFCLSQLDPAPLLTDMASHRLIIKLVSYSCNRMRQPLAVINVTTRTATLVLPQNQPNKCSQKIPEFERKSVTEYNLT